MKYFTDILKERLKAYNCNNGIFKMSYWLSKKLNLLSFATDLRYIYVYVFENKLIMSRRMWLGRKEKRRIS